MRCRVNYYAPAECRCEPRASAERGRCRMTVHERSLTEVVAEADVVVLGGGPGGMGTALEAARSGASVVLVEVRAEIGGNAARSTGYMAFVDSAEQRAQGIRDSAE